MSAQTFVEFWRCQNCSKPYRAIHPTYRKLLKFLIRKNIPMPGITLMCDACSRVRTYSAAEIGAPRNVKDTKDSVFTKRAFVVEFRCTEGCEKPVPVFAPTWGFASESTFRSVEWKFDPNVRCQAGHPAKLPLVNVHELPPEKR